MAMETCYHIKIKADLIDFYAILWCYMSVLDEGISLDDEMNQYRVLIVWGESLSVAYQC